MELGLSGKKAIVTGASRGIGQAIAKLLSEEGVSLAICARDAEGIKKVAEDFRSQGNNVIGRALDVGDGEALRNFVAESAHELGGLDFLVCNPSAGGGTDEEAWRKSFEVDLMGAVRGVDAATPFLSASEAASVVFIGTTAAVESFAGPISYGALKAALIAHTKELSRALASRGIRVNVVSPGPVYFEGGGWAQVKKNAPAMYEEVLANCPQGRMGTPEEIANAVVFLLSSAASLITGEHLVVDGGFTKRVNF